MAKVISVKALRQLVAESSNEFKAVLGPNVESENKKNNGKAYSDAKKRAKDYDGGLEKEVGEDRPKYEKVDGNKTTLDYNPENVNDSYKKRIKAQAKGYTSELEEKNGLEKAGDFSDNENIFNGIKDAGQNIHKAEDDFKFTKVQVRDKNPKTYSENEMYESREGFDMRNMIDMFRANEKKSVLKEHVKTVYFKKTTFLNEEHMMSRIPDEFKKEGEQFKMKDKTGNEYLLEWKNNSGNIVGHTNKRGMNESLERMRSMFNYSSTDSRSRLNEGEDQVVDTLNKVRKITE